MSAGKILSIIFCQMEAIVYLTHFNQAILLQSQMLFSFWSVKQRKTFPWKYKEEAVCKWKAAQTVKQR